MRPIDADELKRVLIIEYELREGYFGEIVLNAIDNTPTIPLPDFKEGYKQAIIDGKTNFSRPQGEWKNTRPPEMSDNIVCSLCGFDSIAMFDFCPNCGADMRGAKNE